MTTPRRRLVTAGIAAFLAGVLLPADGALIVAGVAIILGAAFMGRAA